MLNTKSLFLFCGFCATLSVFGSDLANKEVKQVLMQRMMGLIGEHWQLAQESIDLCKDYNDQRALYFLEKNKQCTENTLSLIEVCRKNNLIPSDYIAKTEAAVKQSQDLQNKIQNFQQRQKNKPTS